MNKTRIVGWLGSEDWSLTLVIAVVLGFFAVGYEGWASGRSASVAPALVLAGACLLVGVLLGFLFGIPRSLQNQGPDQEATASGSSDGNRRKDSAVQYLANTNLEQISDWLTKILVGVGLSQLNNLPSLLARAGTYFSPSLGSGDAGASLTISVIVFFSISGFLGGYLWTRLFLGGELVKADLAALNQSVKEIKQAQEEQSQIDAKALSLANQYLFATDTPNVSINDLKQAVQAASAPVKVQIFYQAREARKDYRDRSQKPKMERTIPIFEALAAGDPEKMYHRNYGQLGYALMDKRQPDYAAAEKALSTAIEIRGDAAKNGYALYEFTRAICRIRQDPDFQQGRETRAEIQKLIRDDLEIALKEDPEFDNAEVSQWRELNP